MSIDEKKEKIKKLMGHFAFSLNKQLNVRMSCIANQILDDEEVEAEHIAEVDSIEDDVVGSACEKASYAAMEVFFSTIREHNVPLVMDPAECAPYTPEEIKNNYEIQ
jgi:hypothetical protein